MDIKEYRCAGMCCPIGRALPSTGAQIELMAGNTRIVVEMQSHEFYQNGVTRCLIRLADVTGVELCYVVCAKGPDE